MSAQRAGESFYVTTPIFYVNDAPHIGHAYTEVAADVLARWHRQRGENSFLLTGTDEHGEKVLRTAAANKVSPQDWTDKLVHDAWLPLLETIDIDNQDFIRTTEPRHEANVQKFMQHLYDTGFIYQGSRVPIASVVRNTKIRPISLTAPASSRASKSVRSTRSRSNNSKRPITFSS